MNKNKKGNTQCTTNILKNAASTLNIFLSPLWGMHRWEHNGSQSRSASSGRCWHHLHGQEAHHGSVETVLILKSHLFSLHGFQTYLEPQISDLQTSPQLSEGKTQLPPPAPAPLGSPGWLTACSLDGRLDDGAARQSSDYLQGTSGI